MADPTQEPSPDDEPKRKFPMLAIVVVVSGILGVTSGLALVAPRVLASRTAAQTEADAPADGDHGGEKGASQHAPSAGEPGTMMELGNILVNPAGSQGLRFLMVAVAFEVANNDLRDLLHRREAHVRDIVISVLEDQTLAALSSPGARDTVKARLAEAIRPLVGNTPVTVYVPQFVIN